MASRFHKSRQRRAERQPLTEHGNLNLVPLVDILTSIVFFSLATYTGAALAALTAFDLSLPPTVVTAPQQTENMGNPPNLTLLLAVRVNTDGLQVEHSGGGGFQQKIAGLSDQSMAQLRDVLTRIRRTYPDNADILVVPDDAVSYDNLVKVLDQARASDYRSISLGNRARSSQVATRAPATGGR
ncbi:MAG TPA: biopolymer transporter ExbD [Gemmatimonadaceae bacterium]|nr:biopolymer transporter ExbD [Gemmatimonadaceae bacterium]